MLNGLHAAIKSKSEGNNRTNSGLKFKSMTLRAQADAHLHYHHFPNDVLFNQVDHGPIDFPFCVDQ